MQRWLFMICVCFCSYIGYGQQDPHVTMNMFNHMAINPGHAGSFDGISAGSVVRNQYMGFSDDGGSAISTQYFNAHGRIKLFGMYHGLGLSLLNDKIGFNNNLGMNLAYAYRTTAGSGDLGIGVNLGFMNSKLESAEWIYPTNGTPDVAVPSKEAKAMTFDAGFGLFYNTDNLYMGLSIAHLMESQVNYPEGNMVLDRTFYLTAGYNYQLLNPLFEVRPSVFVSSDIASTQFSINGLLMYNKRFWGGLGYRNIDAISVMAGIELISALELGVAYDFSTSAMQKYNDGSVEIMLRYNFTFKVEKDSKTYKSIRYL